MVTSRSVISSSLARLAAAHVRDQLRCVQQLLDLIEDRALDVGGHR
jgi:hypothetical protein